MEDVKQSEIKKNDSLMKKFGLMLILYAVLVIVLSTVITLVNQRSTYRQQYEDHLRKLSGYICDTISGDSEDFSNLLLYFKENKDKLRIPMDYDGNSDPYWQAFVDQMAQRYPGMAIDYNIVFEELDDETKNAYATYLFLRYLDMFESARDEFDFGSVYFIYPTTDYNMAYMIDFDRYPVEIDGKEYIDLGIEAYEDPALHPNMWKVWETQQVVDDFDILDNEYGHVYAFHTPLIIKGEACGLVVSEAKFELVRSEIINAALNLAIIMFIVTAICTIVALVILKRIMLKPIVVLKELVCKYSLEMDPEIGDSIREVTKNNDEIGTLSNAFADMIVALEKHVKQIEQITAEREKAEAELSVASMIQASALPNPEDFAAPNHEFEVYATMRPAKEVGGDFYDFYMIDEDHLALTIADVSGKGVPASLFMMISKLLIKNEVGYTTSPKEIFETVNNKLCENNQAEMFVTAWCAILNLKTGVLTCGNAGHEYPVIRRAGGQFELYEDEHDIVLAAMEDLPYTEYEIQLQKCDSILVYTDGVAEATNSDEELFGTDRLIAALNANTNDTAKERCDDVRKSVDEFAGDAPQFDDITLLSLDFFGRG